MISEFGTGAFACVMDSYDYANALENILPCVAKDKIDKGGVMILRPDSGDPVEVVLMALKYLDTANISGQQRKYLAIKSIAKDTKYIFMLTIGYQWL